MLLIISNCIVPFFLDGLIIFLKDGSLNAMNADYINQPMKSLVICLSEEALFVATSQMNGAKSSYKKNLTPL